MRENSVKSSNDDSILIPLQNNSSPVENDNINVTNNNIKEDEDDDDGRHGGGQRSGRKTTLVKLHNRELSAVALKYSQILAESFFLQNVKNCTYADFDTYVRKAHSALLAFLKLKTFDSEDPDLLLRALYSGRVPQNSPLKPHTQTSASSTASISDVINDDTTAGGNVVSPSISATGIRSANPNVGILSTPSYRTAEQDASVKLLNVNSVSNFIEIGGRTTSSFNPSMSQQSSSHSWSNLGFNPTPSSNYLSQATNNASSSSAPGSGSGGGQPPKKYNEKLKAEASVVQRISELQKEGMWYDKRLPRNQEPARVKSHWDYLLEEMTWLAADFATERKWKRLASKKCAKMVDKYWSDLEVERARAEKEEEIRLRRIASFIAKEIKNFWSNAQQIVEYKEQSRIEEMKKKALDQQLSYIVDQTEKYSSMLAESFVADSSVSVQPEVPTESPEEVTRQQQENLSDDEFEPAEESEEDDEETIAKEEEDDEGQTNSISELDELKRSGQMSLDDLLNDLPPGYLDEWTARIEKIDPGGGSKAEAKEDLPQTVAGDEEEQSTVKIEETSVPIEEIVPKSQEVIDVPVKSEETEPVDSLDAAVDLVADASDVPDSASETENESEMEESGSATDDGDQSTDGEESDVLSEEELAPEDEEQTMGLASLLQTFAPERAGENHEDAALNSVAAMAESFQPKGYTLSSTTVVTKVPFLLHHKLREYQHIGLDWLVTMYEKKLNGILADEMGLGKTIQTIALLGHLACEKGNWGPHLVVVPTSVMLNWEMEFKKWCPGFKILTYYGSIKERRLKRTGWTKPNAFHVCITSYKLVIQDHSVFRRKRWKYLILDEAQNIKNFKSQRWQLLLNFSTQRRLLLTGTPLQNNLMELWSLMHFLMPNVFQSHREFREWFSNPVSGMVEGNSDYNEAIISRLHKVLRPFILRRLKSEVEKQLPQKYEHVVMCRLSKRQRFLYEDFMSRAKTKETLSSGNLLSVINVLMQLRKVCNHPNLFEPRPVISPFQCDGLTYLLPSIVWHGIDNYGMKEGTSAIFTMSSADKYYTKVQAETMQALRLLDEDVTHFSAEMAKNDVTLKRKYSVDDDNSDFRHAEADGSPEFSSSSPKKIKFSHWCSDISSSVPRSKGTISFLLMSTDDPGPYLEDDDFVEAIGYAAPRPMALRLSDSMAPEMIGIADEPYSDLHEEVIESNTDEIVSAVDPQEGNASVLTGLKSPLVQSEENEILPSDEDDDTKPDDDPSEGEDEDDEDSVEEGFDSDVSETTEEDTDDGPPKKRRKREISRRTSRVPSTARDTDELDSSRDEFMEDVTADDSCSSDDDDRSTSACEGYDRQSKSDTRFRYAAGTQWVEAMNYNPFEFQEADVQARSLKNRKTLIERLQFINQRRCEILPIFGTDVVDQCTIIGSLPIMRYYGTRIRHLKLPYRKSAPKDGRETFKLGYEDVVSVSLVKNSTSSRIRNHPLLLWRHTKALMNLVWTLEEVLEEFQPILKRFILYVPAVSSTAITSRIFRPEVSLYAKHQLFQQELREGLKEPITMLHPILSAMATQFPDPRLIQYDCGKLQVLESLLRRLKSGSHRVLIFTQMAKMLDVLEAFLNYHGHIYLRLDGATRIDQRQILMEKFNSDKRIFCFILSTRSGGIGVNLTGADTVIFYDSDWNPTMDAQAQDRCHRIGQTRDVHIYRLVSEKTIEENILKKSNQKRFLSELAIEGGNFTTAYFQKSSIYELFNVQSAENDALKRLTDPTAVVNEDKSIVPDTIEPEVPDNDRNKIQLFESALAAAEDETDVEATRNVQAEAAAELAEFDESIPLEELGDGQEIPEASAIDAEMESIMAELSKVEIYALKFMERTIDDWSRETVAQAQKELEQQKKEWELEQARQLELRSKRLGDFSDDEEMITYASGDAENQVWISQGGSEDLMPLWAPPTPPSDEMDVYVDYCHGFLYDYGLIPEASLPPIYQAPKKEKKTSPASVIPAPVKQVERLPTTSQVVTMEEEGSNASSTTVSSMEKKSPKVARRDEPIFPPRSLFDRPSPALAKLRREHRMQKYNCRPMGTTAIPKSSLGPGAITFPIVHPSSSKTPSVPPQHETVEWMIAEDNALLQTIQNILEMPLSLLVVNLAQTPNWDLAAEIVNATSKIYRTPKQCRSRYENTVRPREKGELFYEQPIASKSKKKSKSFIKVGPPSPSRTGRIVKMSQLITADNNSQLLNTYMSKFDVIKNISAKRVAAKPLPANPYVKAVKQAAVILSEHNINVDSPVTATAIAQARFERIQMERRKLFAAQQAAVAAASGTTIQTGHAVAPTTYNPSVTPDSNRITASTISVTTSGTAMSSLPVTSSVVQSPSIVSMAVTPVLPAQPLSVSSGTILTSTASEVLKAKQLAAAAQHQVSTTDLPVIRFNHPSSSTTLQEMIARRVGTASSGATTSTSNTALVTKRQYTVSQQHNQLQQQLQLLQQHQLSQKHPKIALQVTQIKSSQSNTSLQQGGQVQQIQASTPQQIVISQPSMTKPQLGSASQIAASTLQAQSSKQVVMAYPQSLSQQQKQNTTQPIQIQLSGSNQSAIASISQSQPLHVTTQSQSGLVNQSGQQITSTGIQLQSSTKQVMMTGQAPIVVQQPSQQQNTQSQIISQPTTIQIQGPKQVVMAYQSTLPVSSQPQLIHTKAAQGTQPAQVHVHLHPQASSHQGSTLVLPSGLAQALNSVVSSAAMTSTGLMTMTTADSIVSSVNVSSGITTSSFSTAGISRGQVSQQLTATQQSPQGPRTVTMQLVKQHAVGGKTVTRTVSDAEITAFLKQHGLAAPGARVAIATAQPGGQSQLGQISATKGTGTQQVQVPAAQIITSVGLQKLGYQIATSTSGAQLATVLKPSPGQPSVSTSQGTGLAFPLSFSSVKTVGPKSNVPKQSGINTTVQQQVITAQRRQQQPQQPTASKLAHIAQVSQGGVPQLIVQATPKQLQSALNVQSIQNALKPGQTIQSQQGGVLQAQLLTQKSVSRHVATTAAGAPATSVSGVNVTVTTASNPVSAVSTVTIPAGVVTSQSQPSIIRISQQNQPVRTGTIQMIGGHPQSVVLNQQQNVTRPFLTQSALNTNQVIAPVSAATSVAVRLQGLSPAANMDTSIAQATQAPAPAAPAPQSTVTDSGNTPGIGETNVTAKSDEAVVPDIVNAPTN